MSAGRYNRRVTLQAPTISQDSYGAPTETWNDITTLWASIEPLSGREYWEAKRVNAEQTVKIKVRYKPIVKPHMRFTRGHKVYDIESVVNARDENQELVCMCKEIV